MLTFFPDTGAYVSERRLKQSDAAERKGSRNGKVIRTRNKKRGKK